jgi:6-phosphofructokinase 1
MKRIAVLTSGGDAPGMNAAIRSVVRRGLADGCEVLGIHGGFAGLLSGDARVLTSRDVGEIMQRGGTILGSSRSDEFRTEAGRAKAGDQLGRLGVEGIVIIGGNGTQTGANALSQLGVRVIGVASTIDNDVYGFDRTLGVDTALNIALEAIDRLKTTASSHGRGFLIEVMGRDHGFLALMAGMAGGAEAIALPEMDVEPAQLAEELRAASERGKPHLIVVVAEGATFEGETLEDYFEEHKDSLGFELRLTKLGHVQRGGVPTVADRLLGLQAGFDAAQRLLAGEHGIVVGRRGGSLTTVPLSDVASKRKHLDLSFLEMAQVLAL